mgnify:CR=1 FL=1
MRSRLGDYLPSPLDECYGFRKRPVKCMVGLRWDGHMGKFWGQKFWGHNTQFVLAA